jgi:UPF0755 protein
VTQLPPAPRDPHDDGDGDEWHALLRGELPRRSASAPTSPLTPAEQAAAEQPASAAPSEPAASSAAPSAAPSGADRPLTRRELREVEQRQFAEAEAIRLIVEADVDSPGAAAGTGAASSTATRAAGPGPSDSSDSSGTSGEPAERMRRTNTALADLIDFDDEPSAERRPSRAERRAAANHPNDAAEPPRRRRGAWGCLIGLVVVVALAVGAFFVLQGPITALIDRFTPAANYSGQGTGEVLFQVEDGDTGTSIGARLFEQDIVASEAAFLEAIDEAPTAVTFYPGVFRLAEQMSAEAALAGLTDEANRLENTVLIREGMWADDVLAEVSAVLQIPAEELQAVAANPQALGLPAEATSLEGFLFPDTYTFDPGVTAQQVLQQMVDLSLQTFDAAGVPPEDRYRVATIASLIEREGLPQDFGKVSRVVQNRLDEGMPLQFDSTVHYGIADHSDVTTTDAERADAGNVYNTYVHPGLPPGPIGNPGAAAIEAALSPEEGPWLYFVTVNPDTGETVFSTTYAEHEAAAQRFYQWLEEQPADG